VCHLVAGRCRTRLSSRNQCDPFFLCSQHISQVILRHDEGPVNCSDALLAWGGRCDTCSGRFSAHPNELYVLGLRRQRHRCVVRNVIQTLVRSVVEGLSNVILPGIIRDGSMCLRSAFPTQYHPRCADQQAQRYKHILTYSCCQHAVALRHGLTAADQMSSPSSSTIAAGCADLPAMPTPGLMRAHNPCMQTRACSGARQPAKAAGSRPAIEAAGRSWKTPTGGDAPELLLLGDRGPSATMGTWRQSL
jgi:hypothetical protein